MTEFVVRTDPGRRDLVTPASAAIVLDWAPGSTAATIQAATGFFAGWRPARPAADLLVFASGVYCLDKIVSRAEARDAWTREITLHLPAGEPTRWDVDTLEHALRFLTGDHWSVQPYNEPTDPMRALPALPDPLIATTEVDVVSLFSGGLDSLCGVIDLLERDAERRIGLVAHHEGGQGAAAQTVLHSRLAAHYGPQRVVLRQLFLRPAPPHPAQQQRPTPPVETTTRGRSLLFIAAALALASSVGPNVPIIVPENGSIALNVPLTRARVGSLSTRTAHPHFLALLRDVAGSAGVSNPIENPYRWDTKGEMIKECANMELLRELAPFSISCSHPEAPRWRARPQGNCGYCYPCLIRRAALAAAGWDSPDGYSWDALTEADLMLDTSTGTGADLRAVVNAVLARRADSHVLRNAPLPGDRDKYLDVWRRGVDELRDWIVAGATGPLAAIVAPK
jgi:7-cyano-7-deazaguanine synthase in queuosine biosynthesis